MYTFLKDKILDEREREIMMSWETPIMKEHAKIVTENGGDILEIGFGMGICSNFIQKANINTHTIIEINDQIFKRLLKWAKDKPNVIPVKGNWYDDIPTTRKYDAIFYDGFGDMINKRFFASRIMQHCKVGTIITWYNNFLEKQSQYDGDVKKVDGHKKIEQFDRTERITYQEVELSIPERARIDWYLKGTGNTYYAPQLIVDNNDLN